MNNPDTDIFKIDRENDIEKFSRYGEKGISSINNIKRSNIPSRLGRDKVVAGNYRLSGTPKQFIKGPQKQFIKNLRHQFNKYPQRRPNRHNFPKLDNFCRSSGTSSDRKEYPITVLVNVKYLDKYVVCQWQL